MTLYELLKRLSEIITPETDDFYEYALHTSDDNGGFLRTRYCWWDKCVENHIVRSEYKKVLVTSKEQIDSESFEKLNAKEKTTTKMQITYGITDAKVENAEWDVELGFNYVYVFNLENNTFTEEYVERQY